MPIAKWDDSYRTGHVLVDRQHQELFRMVNELHDAIIEGKGNDVLAPTLKKLAKYTVEHFRDEEVLMASINYPMLVPHKKNMKILPRRLPS